MIFKQRDTLKLSGIKKRLLKNLEYTHLPSSANICSGLMFLFFSNFVYFISSYFGIRTIILI
jgi:hypothetical protein